MERIRLGQRLDVSLYGATLMKLRHLYPQQPRLQTTNFHISGQCHFLNYRSSKTKKAKRSCLYMGFKRVRKVAGNWGDPSSNANEIKLITLNLFINE